VKGEGGFGPKRKKERLGGTNEGLGRNLQKKGRRKGALEREINNSAL